MINNNNSSAPSQQPNNDAAYWDPNAPIFINYLIREGKRVYKEATYLEDGVPTFINYLITDGNRLSAHFYDIMSFRKFYFEELRSSDGTQEKTEKIFQDHLAEVQYTLGYLNERKKPLSEAIKDGSFIEARKKYIFKRTDCGFFTLELEVDHKKVQVTYIKPNKERIFEQIGDLDKDTKTPEELYEELIQELKDVFRQVKESGKTCEEAVADNSFLKFRRKQVVVKEIGTYLETLQRYVEMFCILNKDAIENGDFPPHVFKDLRKESENSISIVDWDIPPHITLVGVLTGSSYRREAVPSIPTVDNAFLRLRQARSGFIRVVKENAEIIDYQLYKNMCEPVFIQMDGKCHVIDPALYKECLSIPTSPEILQAIAQPITEAFIVRGVALRVISEKSKHKVKKWLGKSLIMALLESNVYGNIKQVMEFTSQESIKWENDKCILFSSMLTYLQKQGMGLESAKKTADYVYGPLEKPLALQIYKYLQGEIALKDLDVKEENALEVLDVIKLFDWGISLLNWGQIDKQSYLRTSYELKAYILEIVPSAKTHQVFTKTLQTQDLTYCLEHMDPTRVGMHMKAVGNMYIAAKELSKKLDKILGVRGNTASGKSTVAPYGSLNVDDIKAFLKAGYKILNSQVHPEAAKVFERVLEEIKTKLAYYCMNARLIEDDYVESCIFGPAKEHGVDAEIQDFEVPLSTSLLRILTRPLYGKDPCPSLHAVVDGFVRLRKEREAVIKRSSANDRGTYKLFFKQGSSKILVAEKVGEKFEIYDQALFKECLRVPNKEEIDQLLNQSITTSLIEQAVKNQDIYDFQAKDLIPYLGKTLEEAMKSRPS